MKLGDKVVRCVDTNAQITVGKIYTIKNFSKNNTFLLLKEYSDLYTWRVEYFVPLNSLLGQELANWRQNNKS